MKELVEYCIWSTSASVFMFCSSTGSGDICPLYETIQPNYLSKDLPVDWPLSWPDLPPTAQQASYVSHNTVWYIAVICPQWLEFKRFHEGIAKTFGVWLLRKCVAICWIHHPVIGLMRSESSPSLCILEFAEPWQSQLKVLPIWPWWIIFRHVLMGYCIHSTVPKVCRLLPAVCALSLSLLNSNWMHWIKLHLKISVSPHWTAAFTYMCNRQENEQQCPLISIFFGNQLWVGEFTFLQMSITGIIDFFHWSHHPYTRCNFT